MYAVNIGDWQAQSNDFGVNLLLTSVVDKDLPLDDCEPGRFDGASARLLCDEERAAAIIAMVRKKYQKHELRFYRSSTGKGWKRV